MRLAVFDDDMEEDIDVFDLECKEWGFCLRDLFGLGLGTGDYGHLSVEHASMLLRNFRSLRHYSNQGFEAAHKLQKQIYSRATNHDGSGEATSLDQILTHHYAEKMLFLRLCFRNAKECASKGKMFFFRGCGWTKSKNTRTWSFAHKRWIEIVDELFATFLSKDFLDYEYNDKLCCVVAEDDRPRADYDTDTWENIVRQKMSERQWRENTTPRTRKAKSHIPRKIRRQLFKRTKRKNKGKLPPKSLTSPSNTASQSLMFNRKRKSTAAMSSLSPKQTRVPWSPGIKRSNQSRGTTGCQMKYAPQTRRCLFGSHRKRSSVSPRLKTSLHKRRRSCSSTTGPRQLSPPSIGSALGPSQSSPPSMGSALGPSQSSPPSMGSALGPSQSSPPSMGSALGPSQSSPPSMGSALGPSQSSPPSMGSALGPSQLSPPSMGSALGPSQSSPPSMGSALGPSQSSPPSMGSALGPSQSSPPSMGSALGPSQSSPPSMGSALGPSQSSPPSMGSASVTKGPLNKSSMKSSSSDNIRSPPLPSYILSSTCTREYLLTIKVPPVDSSLTKYHCKFVRVPANFKYTDPLKLKQRPARNVIKEAVELMQRKCKDASTNTRAGIMVVELDTEHEGQGVSVGHLGIFSRTGLDDLRRIGEIAAMQYNVKEEKEWIMGTTDNLHLQTRARILQLLFKFPLNHVITKEGEYSVDVRTFSNLTLERYIDDTVINTTLARMQRQYDVQGSVLCLPAHATVWLDTQDENFIHDCFQEVLQDVKPEILKAVLLPVNMNDAHWGLLVIDVPSKVAYFDDGLGWHSPRITILYDIMKELQVKFPECRRFKDWEKLKAFKRFGMPRQPPGSGSCGIGIILSAQNVMRLNADLPPLPWNFSEMTVHRKEIMKLLL